MDLQVKAELTPLETKLLHALQIYTREDDIEVIRLRLEKDYLQRKEARKKK